MRTKNRKALLVLLVSAATLAGPVSAQTKVMREKDVTELGLIDALTPPPEPEGTVRTRSFKPVRDPQAQAAAARPVKAVSASLLITFETNSAELTAQAKQSLDVVGRALNSDKLADFRFSVEGHADPRGDSGSNMELSKQRAEAVRNFLVQNNHVEERRLDAVGKGDRELLNPANPFAPENRRVAIVNVSQ
jgi:OOP family OmpA-OmpF porin